MRKIWNYIKNTPLNPVLIIVFFTIIGGVLLIALEDNEKKYGVFFILHRARY